MKELFNNRVPFSFEVFPPKKEDEFESVYQTLDQLGQLQPDFISVTYGAGGSRSKSTVEIASYIQNKLNIPSLAHMTCVGNKKENINAVCEKLIQENVQNILALRGDRPVSMDDEQYHTRDFIYANDLIAHLKSSYNFNIAGACYPEKHFEAMSKRADISHLKDKVNTGCEFLITQLFLDNDSFFSFQENCLSSGITVPICAGIMPITSIKQIATTISLSGASIPKAFSDLAAKYAEKPDDFRKAGIEIGRAHV